MDVRETSAAGSNASRHPWELARLGFVQGLLDVWAPAPKSVLDIGCGDCFVLTSLAGRLPGTFVGVEPELEKLPTKPAVRVVTSTAELGDQRFELILLLDVLEHVENDRGFLQSLVNSHLAPKGQLVVTVPAHQSLFSDHDRFLLHFRRYSRKQLDLLACDAGLTVQASGELFHSLYVIRRLQKLMGLVGTGGVGAWRRGRGLTAAVEAALNLDGHLPGWLPGLSAWGVWSR